MRSTVAHCAVQARPVADTHSVEQHLSGPPDVQSPLPRSLAPRRFGQAGGIPRRLCPILTGLREEVVDGQYGLVRF